MDRCECIAANAKIHLKTHNFNIKLHLNYELCELMMVSVRLDGMNDGDDDN